MFFVPVFDFIFTESTSKQSSGHAIQRKELKDYAELKGKLDYLDMGLFVLVRIIVTCKEIFGNDEK